MGGADLELHRQLREGDVAELVGEAPHQRLGGVEVGAAGHRAADGAQRLGAEQVATAGRRGAPPEVEQPVDDGGLGVLGDQRAVHRADAGAEHQVGPHAALEQRPEHADLDRPEHTAPAEDERGGHGRQTAGEVSVRSGVSARTLAATTRSTQKMISGTRPATSMSSVKPSDQRARRASSTATTT